MCTFSCVLNHKTVFLSSQSCFPFLGCCELSEERQWRESVLLLRPAGSNPHPVMLKHFLSQNSQAKTTTLMTAVTYGKRLHTITEKRTMHLGTCKDFSRHQTFEPNIWRHFSQWVCLNYWQMSLRSHKYQRQACTRQHFFVRNELLLRESRGTPLKGCHVEPRFQMQGWGCKVRCFVQPSGRDLAFFKTHFCLARVEDTRTCRCQTVSKAEWMNIIFPFTLRKEMLCLIW